MPEEKSFEKIPLQSNDGTVIVVDYDVATRSALLNTMLDDLKGMGVSDLGPVPLPNVQTLPSPFATRVMASAMTLTTSL